MAPLPCVQGCSVDKMENCSEEQKGKLKEYIDMAPEKRTEMLETLKKELADAESTHEALLKELQVRDESATPV